MHGPAEATTTKPDTSNWYNANTPWSTQSEQYKNAHSNKHAHGANGLGASSKQLVPEADTQMSTHKELPTAKSTRTSLYQCLPLHDGNYH